MKQLNAIIIVLFVLSQASLAQDKIPAKKTPNIKKVQNKKHKNGDKHDHSSQDATLKRLGDQKVIIKVKGMVCAFCAQGIEKNFNKLAEVKSTKVDLDTMEVTVSLKKNKKMTEKKIKDVVTSAGFNYVGLKK